MVPSPTKQATKTWFNPQCHLCGCHEATGAGILCTMCRHDLAPTPKLHLLPNIDAVSLYSYQYPLDRYITQYKNHQALHHLPLLQYILLRGLNAFTQQATLGDNAYKLEANQAWQDWCAKRINAKWAIAAVPSSTTRLQERGFSHTYLLCQQLALHLQIPIYTGLTRLHNRQHQQGLGRKLRLSNVDGVFEVVKPPPSSLLLIDDVITTGSTLNSASNVLSDRGVNVFGLALARGELNK